MLKMLKEKSGYISIETVIVAGLMLALGVFALGQFKTAADTASTTAIDAVNAAFEAVPSVEL